MRSVLRQIASHFGTTSNRLHYLLPLVLGILGGGCQRYVWTQSPEQIVAAEHGRVCHFRQIGVMDQSRWIGWHPVLVETCGQAQSGTAVPCWPADNRGVSQDALGTLYWNAPDFRQTNELLNGAANLNREIGSMKLAWIVGTNPLAIAFLDKQSASTGSPLPTESLAATKQSTGAAYPRSAHLISLQSLQETADVLLIFPTNMTVEWGYPMDSRVAKSDLRATVFKFRKPLRLDTLIQRVSEQPKEYPDLIRKIEVPVQSR